MQLLLLKYSKSIDFENTSKEGDKVTKICEEIDVSTFGFFQRNSIGEFIRFTHTVVLGKNYRL